MMKNFFYIIIVCCSIFCFGMEEVRDIKESVTHKGKPFKESSPEELLEYMKAFSEESAKQLRKRSEQANSGQVKRNINKNKSGSNTKEHENTITENIWSLLCNKWVGVGLATGVGYFVWKYFINSKKQSLTSNSEAATK